MPDSNSSKEQTFDALSLAPALLSAVKDLGYESLTPVQAQSIPPLLAGEDLVAQSKTGSGKTAAYALPLLQKVDVRQRVVSALVVCPTRELSAQVAREFRKLGKNLPGLAVLVLAGGQPAREQSFALRKGVHVVVGTPGRLLDHLRRQTLRPDDVSSVVLDEADRMLDMGFQEDVAQILAALPAQRQTILFSATFPDSINALVAQYLHEPKRVKIEEQEQVQIRQLVLPVREEGKMAALRWVLQHTPHDTALVFANRRLAVAELSASLADSGFSVAGLHGDLEQFDRDRVMAKFRNGSTRILFATDVAARGIDLEKLDLVVNYELPTKPEIYVHRIGRTGRAGREGLAISLCSERERRSLQAIEQFIVKPLRVLAADDAGAELVAEISTRRDGAASARAVAGGASPSGTLAHGAPAHAAPPLEAKMETLKIFAGRKDKLRTGDILGALTGEAGGLNSSDIGKIEIHDRFAYVAVAKTVSRQALKNLNQGRIKGRRFKTELVK